MTELADLLADVRAAPDGPEIVACFDYDGTVIAGYSASAFYSHRIKHLEIGPVELARTLLMTVRGLRTEEEFGKLLEISLAAWRGRREQELEELGTMLFRKVIGPRMREEAFALIDAHQQKGHTLVLASSATRYQVEPMARELGFDHVLCTSVEVRDGMLTGRAAGRPLWSAAKAAALRGLASELDLDLDASFAYSNGGEDVPLLESVGYPACIEPEKELTRVAGERGWPVLRCVTRGERPSLLQTARAVGLYGSFAGASWLGGALWALGRGRQSAADITIDVGSEFALAIVGVKVKVLRGREHLFGARPCVFMFNHQSNLDALVVMNLLKGGFTGVAKAEAKRIPVFGPLFQIAGVAFVDRGNTKQALGALEPAVRKVREEGLSLVLSPEGTRSLTPRLGRFKKGGFHIAMQAEVPIVPIVLRGAGDLQRKGDQTVRPGTVEVIVLPPVDTSEWTVQTIDDHVAEVRALFARTLAQWPGPAQLTAGEPVATS